MSVLFVTGTDTGVGKTFVACALALAFRAAGHRVGVMKPVETGVVDQPEDALRLAAAAGDRAPLDEICPYRLRAPLAPSVAAAGEGVVINVERLLRAIARRAAGVDVLLVEGAGGLLVPIVGATTFLDLAVQATLPVLLVGANRLGTVNHCALNARVAGAAGLDVRGFVLSQPTLHADESSTTNAEVVATLAGLRCRGVLPHLPDPAAAAALLEIDDLVGG